MLPGRMGKTDCKKGFVQGGQTILPADELVRLGHKPGFSPSIQWADVAMGSGYSVTIPWPLTATLLTVVSVHGGDTRYDMWPSYNGKILFSEAKNVNGYVLGLFR